MPSDYESGTKKTIDLSIQAEKITSDILKNAMAEFLDGKAEKKGRMTLRQLEKKSQSKLESIEVTDNNISDFLQTARKYDVDFALKRDKSTSPPTYHVFFSASKNESFNKAFSEYAGRMKDKLLARGEMSRDALKKQAQKIARQPRKKEKVREKTKDMSH
ncbi:MAG: PcfB family protein [Porcipelethomonas sp.]